MPSGTPCSWTCRSGPGTSVCAILLPSRDPHGLPAPPASPCPKDPGWGWTPGRGLRTWSLVSSRVLPASSCPYPCRASAQHLREGAGDPSLCRRGNPMGCGCCEAPQIQRSQSPCPLCRAGEPFITLPGWRWVFNLHSREHHAVLTSPSYSASLHGMCLACP